MQRSFDQWSKLKIIESTHRHIVVRINDTDPYLYFVRRPGDSSHEVEGVKVIPGFCLVWTDIANGRPVEVAAASHPLADGSVQRGDTIWNVGTGHRPAVAADFGKPVSAFSGVYRMPT